MRRGRPTTYDIARIAGVSQTTASMILSGKVNVSFSPETIEKVQSAAKALGYVGRERKTTLIDGNSKIIAIICPALSNPYYSSLNQSIENAASAKGYVTITCNTYRNREIEQQYLDMLANSTICGIVYTFMPHQQDRVRVLSSQIPIVIITDKDEFMETDTVELNSVESGIMIADHLLALGHRKVAFVTSSLSKYNTPRIRRLQGVKERFSAAGAELVISESQQKTRTDYYDLHWETRIGYESTKPLIKDKDITAFIGINDMLAYGIVNALLDMKYHIPEDYSVCGFDNIFPSSFNGISLTTIEHSLSEKGSNAFELLERKIEARADSLEVPPICRIEYRPKLIVRNSTGPARPTH